MNKLFEPISIKNLRLANRIVMPPMCMYSATDGVATAWHDTHYATRAVGGVGLIVVEATGVSPEGRISDNDLGLWNGTQRDALAAIVSHIHSLGGKIGIQIGHAGRKSEVTGVQIEAPSALAYDENSRTPKAMSADDIRDTVLEFRQAASYAAQAGFDLVEIHAAHGYLINQFLSPLANLRDDAYGGSVENRIRILVETLEAVGDVWPKEKPIAVRVTAEDYRDGGNTAEDLAKIINLVKNIGNGIDLVNVSTGGVVPVVPKAFPGYQLPHAKLIREATGLPVIGGGLISTAEEVEEALAAGKADLIYLGRELLRNPYWVLAADPEDKQSVWPKQYERGKPRIAK
jgi:NADPH2 dehydrogenase